MGKIRRWLLRQIAGDTAVIMNCQSIPGIHVHGKADVFISDVGFIDANARQIVVRGVKSDDNACASVSYDRMDSLIEIGCK